MSSLSNKIIISTRPLIKDDSIKKYLTAKGACVLDFPMIETSGVDLTAYDRKVVADFTRPDGSLKVIPAQRKKLEAVLRYVVEVFEPGKRYSEKQVNQLLVRFHADTASLRRELVGNKLMARAGGGGEYWRV